MNGKKERQNKYGQNNDQKNAFDFHAYFMESVFKQDVDTYDQYLDKVSEYAKNLAKYDKFSISMMRNIYSKIMKADKIVDLKRLRIQFAYIFGRNKDKTGVKDFMKLLDALVKKLKKEEEIQCIKDFVEAVVAYMKFHGDKY